MQVMDHFARVSVGAIKHTLVPEHHRLYHVLDCLSASHSGR